MVDVENNLFGKGNGKFETDTSDWMLIGPMQFHTQHAIKITEPKSDFKYFDLFSQDHSKKDFDSSNPDKVFQEKEEGKANKYDGDFNAMDQ